MDEEPEVYEGEEALTDSYADSEEDQYDESYLDLNLQDAQDLITVDADEYELKVEDAKIGKKNEPYLLARCSIINVPNAKDITHVMMLPLPDKDDEREINRKKLRIRDFMAACGVDYSGKIDLAGLKGATFWAILTKEEDPQYGEQNRIRRVIVGR